jgi:hypothetical protein
VAKLYRKGKLLDSNVQDRGNGYLHVFQLNFGVDPLGQYIIVYCEMMVDYYGYIIPNHPICNVLEIKYLGPALRPLEESSLRGWHVWDG